MKKITLSLLLLILCAGFTTLASADTTLTFVNNPYGVTGPYGFHVGNSSTVTPLVCGSDQNFIAPPYSWSVDVLTIGQMNGVWGLSESDWADAAYYANLLLQHPGNSTYQNAVWNALGFGGAADSSDMVPAAWTASNMVFYIPAGSEQNYSSGLPQPFIGTPEPASLMLLGSGLLGLVGLKRKRMSR
jgi:PEP-CTERM motif